MRRRQTPDERAKAEAFADAMLAPHRTAPPRRPDGDSITDLPLAFRKWRAEDAPPLEPYVVERIRSNQRAYGRLEAAQAVVTLVGMVGLGYFFYELLTTF